MTCRIIEICTFSKKKHKFGNATIFYFAYLYFLFRNKDVRNILSISFYSLEQIICKQTLKSKEDPYQLKNRYIKVRLRGSNKIKPYRLSLLGNRFGLVKTRRPCKFSYPLIHTRTCAYQGVRNVSISGKLAYVLNK